MDAAIVALSTAVAGLLFARIDLSESLFDITRTWEHLQLDEAPATLLVLAVGLAWFAWRRYREARAELVARQRAESELASLLEQHRRLAKEFVQLQESERKTLARELHDELGQYLIAIKTDACAIEESVAPQSSAARAAAAIAAHSDHVQSIVRHLIGRLRPIGLDVLGLRAALDHLLEDAQRRNPGWQFTSRIEGSLEPIDEDAALTIYRLVQEGLTNIARHSEAREVNVAVIRAGSSPSGNDGIDVLIRDDGRGADLDRRQLGHGLRGMRERVEMLAGELHLSSAPNQGFQIAARIPLACEPLTAATRSLAAAEPFTGGAGRDAGQFADHSAGARSASV